MNNFNLNNVNLSSQVSLQKANLVKPAENNSNSAPQNNIQNQNLNYSQANPVLLNNQFIMPQMENDVLLKYLQNLLNLPSSIDKFLNEANNINPKLKEVLIENLINVKSLNQFLNENSKEAILKVIDTISYSLKTGMSDVSDLKEVLNILNIIQANSKDLSSNTIKELLLMYIPLSFPIFEKKTEGFSNLSEEENKKTKESSLSILFETINFSNLLISIEESDLGLFIYLYSTPLFPKERFEKIVKSSLNKTNINILFEFHKIKENENKKGIQNFSIMSNDYIKPDTLFLAHLMITSVLKLDYDFT